MGLFKNITLTNALTFASYSALKLAQQHKEQKFKATSIYVTQNVNITKTQKRKCDIYS